MIAHHYDGGGPRARNQLHRSETVLRIPGEQMCLSHAVDHEGGSSTWWHSAAATAGTAGRADAPPRWLSRSIGGDATERPTSSCKFEYQVC
jgi:hypothetical protein